MKNKNNHLLLVLFTKKVKLTHSDSDGLKKWLKSPIVYSTSPTIKFKDF